MFKHVSVNGATGVITITYSANTPQINGNTVILSPFIGGVALATGLPGNIDWACTSAANAHRECRRLLAQPHLATCPPSTPRRSASKRASCFAMAALEAPLRRGFSFVEAAIEQGKRFAIEVTRRMGPMCDYSALI